MNASDHVLPRSGRAPLAFRGRLVARADSQTEGGEERSHLLALYQTAAGRWVAEVRYRTTHRHDTPSSWAADYDRLEEAVAVLRDWDPRQDPRPFPAGEKWRRRAEPILEDLERRFDEALGRLLEDLPETWERVQ